MSALPSVHLRRVFGECLTTREVADLVGSGGWASTLAAIRKRRSRGGLIAFRGGLGDWLYPAIQFRNGVVKDEFHQVLKALPALEPDDIASWFASPAAELRGMSPIQLLRSEPRAAPAVAALAQRLGQASPTSSVQR